MKKVTTLFIVLTITVFSVICEAQQKWISLFNGKDLSGWFVRGKARWSVQNGVLVGEGGIAAGGADSVALRSDGTVWTWGNNGDGAGTNQLAPVRLRGIFDVVSVAAGVYHTVALCADGTVWTWGWNDYGQLGRNGDGTVPGRVNGLGNVVAIAAGQYHTMAVTADGRVMVAVCGVPTE